MRKLIQGTALLAVIVLVVACEEMTAPPTAPKAEPDTRLYTEIGADELLERWSVLPNGAVAEAVANPSGRRLAAATDGFSGLSSIFRFSDTRRYGACVVFTIEYEFEVKGVHGEAGPRGCPDPECDEPGEDIEVEVEVDEPVVITGTVHIIDCVGAPDAGNTVEGLFHTALVCDSGLDWDSSHVLRAGNFNPTTHVHEFGVPGVTARIGDHSGSFQWYKHYPHTIEGIDPILMNWAFLITGGGMAGFDSLHRRDELHFQIDHSKGVVKVEANDGAAFTEYRSRCVNLR